MNNVAFEGFDEFERHLLRVAAETAYVTLADKSHGEEQVGRFDYNEQSYRSVQLLASDLEPHPFPPQSQSRTEAETEPARYVHAALAWARRTAADNSTGEARKLFRLKAYSPKGERLLFSGQFYTTRNLAPVTPQLDSSVAEIEKELERDLAAVPQGEMAGLLAVVRAFVRMQHEAWRKLIDQAMLMGQQSMQLGQQYSVELQHSRSQVNALVDRMISERLALAQAEQAIGVEERTVEARKEATEKVVGEIGRAVSTIFAAKTGLDPQTAEILMRLKAHPRAAQILASPKLKKIVESPEDLETLTQVLGSLVGDDTPSDAPPTTPITST